MVEIVFEAIIQVVLWIVQIIVELVIWRMTTSLGWRGWLVVGAVVAVLVALFAVF